MLLARRYELRVFGDNRAELLNSLEETGPDIKVAVADRPGADELEQICLEISLHVHVINHQHDFPFRVFGNEVVPLLGSVVFLNDLANLDRGQICRHWNENRLDRSGTFGGKSVEHN